MRRRRWRYWLQVTLMVGVGSLLGAVEMPGRLALDRIVYRLPPDRSPIEREVRLKLKHLDRGCFSFDPREEEMALQLKPHGVWPRRVPGVTLRGGDARILLERVLVQVNQRGAGRDAVQTAVDLLSEAGSVEEYIHGVVQGAGAGEESSSQSVLRVRARWHGGWNGERISSARPGQPSGTRAAVDARRLLALEMALHEEVERRALEGELAMLEARWREAEEIASIADTLPDDPLKKRISNESP